MVLAGCSSGDGTDIERGATGATDTAARPSDEAAATDPGSATTAGGPIAPDALPGESTSPATSATGTRPTSVPVSGVPGSGAPGLDSDDAFCAAWSRFGGSFQVVAVNAAFGSGSAVDPAFVEVAAGPTVASAYAELTEYWPDAIAVEADVALDEWIGPLARRLAVARDALVAEGATPDQLDDLEAAWLAFLAERDPSEAEVTLALDDELAGIVTAAVPGYLDQVGLWTEDDSLATEVSVPLTEDYLASECPDQGTLAGGEVDG